MQTVKRFPAPRIRMLGAASIAALLAASAGAQAQGLMSGTGMQPSKQLATPPSAPAIDQPGAEQRALAQRARMKAARTAAHATPSTQTAAPPHP